MFSVVKPNAFCIWGIVYYSSLYELYETGLIKESREKVVYEGNETLGTKPRTIYPYDYDFISYDYLKQRWSCLSSDRF